MITWIEHANKKRSEEDTVRGKTIKVEMEVKVGGRKNRRTLSEGKQLRLKWKSR